ncbi:MAG: trypsin-like serine protease [Bdellovibrionales bacterium]|nr:trypsin-like serine protease [Bdellovibrionales bacterium]
MFYRHSLTLALALALSFSAFASSSSTNIIGGTNVSDSDPDGASTVALVATLSKGQAICTGSLLSASLIVTAAHCVTDERGGVLSPKAMTIVFGSDVRAKNRILAPVAGLKRHPGYDPEASGKDLNDIAVVRFAGGLPPGFRPAKLLSASTAIPNGGAAVLVGYGVNTMAGGGSGAGVLRKVTAEVADGKFAKTEVLIDQRNKKGACHGDSGGPAFARKGKDLLLWGVTNRGYPDNGPDDCVHYSVYTRITTQMAFINSAARALR